MGRKAKGCPVGLICIKTTYLLIILIGCILLLLYHLIRPFDNNNISSISVNTPSVSIIEKSNKNTENVKTENTNTITETNNTNIENTKVEENKNKNIVINVDQNTKDTFLIKKIMKE